jgi:hypothetical protein
MLYFLNYHFWKLQARGTHKSAISFCSRNISWLSGTLSATVVSPSTTTTSTTAQHRRTCLSMHFLNFDRSLSLTNLCVLQDIQVEFQPLNCLSKKLVRDVWFSYESTLNMCKYSGNILFIRYVPTTYNVYFRARSRDIFICPCERFLYYLPVAGNIGHMILL